MWMTSTQGSTADPFLKAATGSPTSTPKEEPVIARREM
jgi:hypothetical protein